MFSFIYFIWAFHLRKELLHTHYHPPFCIIPLLAHPMGLRPLRLSQDKPLGFKHISMDLWSLWSRGLAEGCLGSPGSRGLCTTLEGSNPVFHSSDFPRKGSLSFLSFVNSHPVQNWTLGKTNLSLTMRKILPQSFNLYRNYVCFGNTHEGVECLNNQDGEWVLEI